MPPPSNGWRAGASGNPISSTNCLCRRRPASGRDRLPARDRPTGFTEDNGSRRRSPPTERTIVSSYHCLRLRTRLPLVREQSRVSFSPRLRSTKEQPDTSALPSDSSSATRAGQHPEHSSPGQAKLIKPLDIIFRSTTRPRPFHLRDPVKTAASSLQEPSERTGAYFVRHQGTFKIPPASQLSRDASFEVGTDVKSPACIRTCTARQRF